MFLKNCLQIFSHEDLGSTQSIIISVMSEMVQDDPADLFGGCPSDVDFALIQQASVPLSKS